MGGGLENPWTLPLIRYPDLTARSALIINLFKRLVYAVAQDRFAGILADIYMDIDKNTITFWDTFWENLIYAICEQRRRRSACTSAHSDQCFVVRYLNSIIFVLTISKISKLLLVSVAKQASLSLRKHPKTDFVMTWLICEFQCFQLAAVNQIYLSDLALRLLCVIALDRFGDFVSDEVMVMATNIFS